MGWRPQEGDEEEHDALDGDTIGDAGPADHRRESAGSTADDDVLRRRALQPHRVDHHIEEDRECEQAGRQPVDDDAENADGKGRQRHAERQRFLRRDLARRDRPLRRAGHDSVDIRVVPHVEGAGRSSTHGDTEDRNETDERVDVPGCHHHAGETRKHHQRHDARLQQLEIIARRGLRETNAAFRADCFVIVDNLHVRSVSVVRFRCPGEQASWPPSPSSPPGYSTPLSSSGLTRGSIPKHASPGIQEGMVWILGSNPRMTEGGLPGLA